MSERTRTWVTVPCALVAVGVVVWLAAPWLWVLPTAERAMGTLVSSREVERPHGGHVDTTVFPRIAFVARDGRAVEKEDASAIFTTTGSSALEPGQQVQVFYRPDAPSEFVQQPSVAELVAGAFILVAAALLMGLGTWPGGTRLARALGLQGLPATALHGLVTVVALTITFAAVVGLGWGLLQGPRRLPTALATTVFAGAGVALLIKLVLVRLNVMRSKAPATGDWEDNGFGPIVVVGLFAALTSVLAVGFWVDLIDGQRQLSSLRQDGEWVTATVDFVDDGVPDLTRTGTLHRVAVGILTDGARGRQRFERDDLPSRLVDHLRRGDQVRVRINRDRSGLFELGPEPSVGR
jgi:hypothetical protein